ncbi:MAG: site-2 protease family protein [Burkholderiales bacterium]|nr:site-2 protease family protein [Burkholderiales bacterium]
MELLHIDCLGRPLRLRGSLAGWQQLTWDGHVVSEHPASTTPVTHFTHAFSLQFKPPGAAPDDSEQPTQLLQVRLELDLQWQEFALGFQLFVNEKLISEGKRTTQEIESQVPSPSAPSAKSGGGAHTVGFVAIGLKLLQSAKFIKIALAGATLAAYSWLLSFHFAVALIVCLVVHEYGHLRAMRYFGLRTKGIYLIPFFGGMALSDDKINTRWQDVVIAIMGPSFGLILSLVLWLVYSMTDHMFFAALANFNALLNLINLIPILPLDGGHILKSICFSIDDRLGVIIVGIATSLGIYTCFSLHLSFLAFVMLIGGIEIALEWRSRQFSQLLPLNRYGQVFSTIWYLLTLGFLVGIIWHFANSGDPLLASPLRILQS